MSTINERFKLVRKELGLSQTEFAEKANRSRGEIGNIEYGLTAPKEAIIKSVCIAHNVNRRYLELGEEPMFMPELDPDTEYINALLADSDSPFIDVMRAILKVYVQLTPEDQKRFNAFAASLRDNLKDRD